MTSPFPGPSSRPSASWISDPVPGTPRHLVAGNTKGIYDYLEETGGALSEKCDHVENVESMQLPIEYLIHDVTKQAVHGWSHHHWHNYTVSELPRGSRRGCGLFVLVHLRYAGRLARQDSVCDQAGVYSQHIGRSGPPIRPLQPGRDDVSQTRHQRCLPEAPHILQRHKPRGRGRDGKRFPCRGFRAAADVSEERSGRRRIMDTLKKGVAEE